ncbi:ATP-binding cassette domain-containing protein [Aeromicrobium sp. REDSEA-S32_B7]|uniref:amino acid ABC transporter ATP-binding/permease protein n=1 Tax=Aeromicrobium sp. REDSEA-S32_B7 TaxID=1811526 RepID=UPI000A9D4BDC|nr:ATP-binding cassette domain-containing protein [Aeromicrobium sp. REDSEA-S32_B7]
MSRRSRLLASSRTRLAAGGALGVLAQLSSLGLLLTSGWLVVRAAEQPPVLYLIARGIDHRVRSYEGLARVMPTAGATRRGDVVRTVVADVEALQDGLLRLRLPWVSALVTCAVTVAVVALVLPAAGVALAAFAATALLAARVLVPRLAGAEGSAPTALSPDVTELVLAAPDLVAYASARGRDVRAHAAVDALARQDRRRAWAGGLGSLVVLVSCAACVLATALLTADAGLTGPLVGVLLLAPVGLVDVLDAVAEAERLRPRVQAARRRLVALEGGSDPMPAPLDGTRRPDGFALDLQDVTLGWDADLVEHLTVHVPEGARVVVTGPSGSGKSTLAATLSRLVAARSGTVRLGGVDLLDLDREQVRAVVGWMQQDTVLFDTTVRENLRVADPRADDATLWRALGRVRLADTVASWPDGLDTVLGEDGSRVSGGERQRLGLARMLLAGHRVLVLDEPTEHLDGETARALLDDVDALAPEHTVVVVSHAPEVVARYPQRVDLRPSPVRRPRVVR